MPVSIPARRTMSPMRRRPWVLVAIASAGCGRIRFDALPTGDATRDSSGGDACTFGAFGPVRELSEVDSTDNDDGPWLSDDRTVLVFASDRLGVHNLYIAQRASAADLFGAPVEIALATSSATDPFLSRDELTLWFSVEPSDTTGAVFVASRASPSDAFGTPQQLSELDVSAYEAEPSLTADQLTIVFTASVGNLKLYSAQRATTTDAFGTAQLLVAVVTPVYDCCATVSADASSVVFATSALSTDLQIEQSQRGATGFDPPTVLDASLHVAGTTDADPYLTSDGLTLVFASARTGGTGATDLYTADRACQ